MTVQWDDGKPVTRRPKGTRTSTVGTRLTDPERARFDLLRATRGESMNEYLRRLIAEDDARQREARRHERERAAAAAEQRDAV